MKAVAPWRDEALKLSAGLAHELNNPASAAKRATGQLRELLKGVRDASHELGKRNLTKEQRAEIEHLEASLMQNDYHPQDALAVAPGHEHDHLERGRARPWPERPHSSQTET